MTSQDKNFSQIAKELANKIWGKPEQRNLIQDLEQLSTAAIAELSVNVTDDDRTRAMFVRLFHSPETVKELQAVKALTCDKRPKPTLHYKELALTALQLASLRPTIEELASTQKRLHEHLEKENKQD